MRFTDEMIRAIIPRLTVGYLQMELLTRQLAAGTLETYIGPSNNQIINIIEHTKAAYSSEVRKRGKDHKMGSPDVQIAIKVIDYLVIVLTETPAKFELQRFLDEVPQGPHHMQEYVGVFRLCKMTTRADAASQCT